MIIQQKKLAYILDSLLENDPDAAKWIEYYPQYANKLNVLVKLATRLRNAPLIIPEQSPFDIINPAGGKFKYNAHYADSIFKINKLSIKIIITATAILTALTIGNLLLR